VQVVEQPVLNAQLAQWHAPRGASMDMRLVSLQRALTDQVRSSALPKWGAVVLILLIGCVNVAGLLISQSAASRREIATRMALGASRRRAQWIEAPRHGRLNLWRPVTLDARVLLMTVLISIATSILFGLLPALDTCRIDIRSVLVEGGRGTPSPRQRRLRQILVVGEIALGMVLLASAGLLIRTLAHLRGLDPGFDPHHVLVAQLSLEDARYKTSASIDSLYRKSLDRIGVLPGVESAAVGLTLPYQRPLNSGFRILDGAHNTAEYSIAETIFVTPGYFETLRMKVKAGRTFSDRDSATAQQVVIINQAFAKKYLRQQSAVGTHVGLDATPSEIVGLVADTPQNSGAGNFGPLSATPTIYIPAAQTGDQGITTRYTRFSPSWIVRTRGANGNLIGEMQSAIQAIDPRLPFSSFKSMEDLQDSSVADRAYYHLERPPRSRVPIDWAVMKLVERMRLPVVARAVSLSALARKPEVVARCFGQTYRRHLINRQIQRRHGVNAKTSCPRFKKCVRGSAGHMAVFVQLKLKAERRMRIKGRWLCA
jgi:hypothetical protein